jgi:DNA-binding NtrC family response regulator
MDQLVHYPWPGNVRELKNVIERAMIISNGDRLQIQGLEFAAGGDGMNADTEESDANHKEGHTWPANVRELKRLIEQAMTISTNDPMKAHGPASAVDDRHVKVTLKEVEKNHILAVLNSTGWRVSGKSGAAKILGLKPTTLEARMKKLGIKRPS